MKKRMLAGMIGLVAVGVVFYLGAQTRAQQNQTRAQTRVAVLNIQWVVKNYHRYVKYEQDMKGRMEGFRKQEETAQNRLKALAEEAKKPNLEAARKEQIEAEVVQIRRQMEDLAKAGNKELADKANQEIEDVYKEIRDAAQRFAVANGYEMVLHFADELANSPEYDSPRNIMAKLHSKSMILLYVHPTMDISGHVVHLLNQQWQARGGQPPAPPRGN